VALTALSILCLRWIEPPTTAFMLRSPLEARSRGVADFRIRHKWVDWDRIAPSAKLAVVAAEDQRFVAHSGFDVESIAEAFQERAQGGRQRGASTISQQVAKNLFLWPDKSFARKALEAWFTAWIELLWSKQRILEVYLNVAQFGDGIFGVEAASRHFFSKSAAALTPRESAILAAVLPNPRRLRAGRQPSDYVSSRVDWILEHMRMLAPTYLSAVAKG
jgi:monofunctional biosynthetic peptidoglycan transglycosylase